MAASDHEADARLGIQNSNAADTAQAVNAIGKRRLAGCIAASVSTPAGRPVIREWEYASGQVIVFARLDSCLGAIQVVDDNTVLGAHFSSLIGDIRQDKPYFSDGMKKAGFDQSKPVLYIGGSVQYKTLTVS